MIFLCYFFFFFCRGFGNISLEEKQNMWTPEKGYSSEELKRDEEKYPRPGSGPGNEYGLNLIMKANIEDYFCSSTNSYGFKVILM